MIKLIENIAKLCKKIFLKKGIILLGLVEKSTILNNGQKVTTSKKIYHFLDNEIENIEDTNEEFFLSKKEKS